MYGTILAADECTPVPVGTRAADDLDRLPADDQGRVIIRLRDAGRGRPRGHCHRLVPDQ
jgi:hypothetical protein